MFWIYFFYAIIGWLASVFFSFETYNSTQIGVSRWESYKKYLFNYTGFIIISFLLLIAFINIINLGGLKELLPLIGFSNVEGNIDILNRIFSLIIGINIEFVMNSIRRYKKPVVLEK